jgi:hypothetical protein
MQHVDEGILHAYLDGALDALAVTGTLPHGVTRTNVESHFRACADCTALLAAERQLRDGARAVLLDAAVSVAAPPFEMVARGRIPPPPPRRSRMRRALPLVWAASVLLAVVTGWWGSELLSAAAGDQPAARASAEEHAAAPLAGAESAVAVPGPAQGIQGAAGTHGTHGARAGRTAFAGSVAAGPPPLATPPASVAAAPASAPAPASAAAAASAVTPASAATAPVSVATVPASAAAAPGALAPAPPDSDGTTAKPLQLNRLVVTPQPSAREPRLAPTSGDVSGGRVTAIRGGAALGQSFVQDSRAPLQADVQDMQSARHSVQPPAAATPPPVPLAPQQLSTDTRTFAPRSAPARPRAEVVPPLQTFRTAVARARGGTLDWQSWDRAALLRAGWLLVVLEEAGAAVIAVAALPAGQPMVQVRQRTAGVEIELLVWQEPGARVLAANTRLATVVVGAGTLPNGDSELLLRVPSLEAFVMLRGALDSRSLLQLADGLALIR